MIRDDQQAAFDQIECALNTLDWIKSLPPKAKAPHMPIDYAPPMGMHEHLVGQLIVDEDGSTRHI